MIHDLFINCCILITFISIVYQVFKGNEINIRSSIKVKVISGIFCGVLGVLLMLNSVDINSRTIIDLRNVPLILISLSGGFIPTIISAFIMAVFRFLYFGATDSSVTAAIVLVILSIGCSFIGKAKVPLKQKWLYCTFTTLLVSSIAIGYLLADCILLMNVLSYYYVATAFASFITYMYTQHLNEAAMLFKKLREESTRDFLTGLNNVRSFDTKYNLAIEQAIEKKEKLSILFIDIDYFKKVNDTYGHQNGDIVLKGLGKLLEGVCRSFDVVSRNGGEEFSVLLLDCPSSHAVEIAERIRSKVEATEFTLLDNTKINITVSIGIATYPDTVTDPEKLIGWADSALYKAKQNGRNRVATH